MNLNNNTTPNTITFFNVGNAEPANMVMRVSKDGLWVNPDLSTDEAADAVIRALDSMIKLMVAKAVEEERDACAQIAERLADQDLEHNFSALIAHNIRARGNQ